VVEVKNVLTRCYKNSLPKGELFIMVRHMENYQSSLDAAFHALADPTRRAVLSRLTKGPASVKELAEPFDMGLPSFMKHLRVLESDGLIRSEKVGRVRTCLINAEKLAAAEAWLSEQRKLWQAQTDRLADYVETQMIGRSEDGN
jgi:DNA-binding transcriptional ArsR family regulator|tara:strand:- start:197 stop:628 length:432 start_codon:yes stop_codon:yes gene_type:complete